MRSQLALVLITSALGFQSLIAESFDHKTGHVLNSIEHRVKSGFASIKQKKEQLKNWTAEKKRQIIKLILRKETKKWCKQHKLVLTSSAALVLSCLLLGTYEYGAHAVAAHVVLPAAIGSLCASLAYFVLYTET